MSSDKQESPTPRASALNAKMVGKTAAEAAVEFVSLAYELERELAEVKARAVEWASSKGKILAMYENAQAELDALRSARPEPDNFTFKTMMPEDLHPATKMLVFQFACALAEKLHAAEKKYGYSDGWMFNDWMDECRAKLREHVEKGDPRDVAAYCAFLWHHKESTSSPSYVEGSHDYRALYNELLYQVARKHPDETRHQTALRYIKQAESGGDNAPAKAAR